MSKQAILAIRNINLFSNENPEIQFSLSRENKVMANFSAYDKEKGYDLRGVKQRSNSGVVYFRLVLSLIGVEGEKRSYFQGALFKNDKKADGDKSPDYRGSINITDDIKVALSAWMKTGEKAGRYLSIAISEFRSETAATPAASQQAAKPRDPFDMDDDMPPPAPAARQAPARPASQAPAPAGYRSTPPRRTPEPARPAPAQARQPAPAGDGWDDDIDPPF
jgi:hypothetical protein